MQQREEVPKGPVPARVSRLEDAFAYHLAKKTWLPSIVVQTKIELPPTEEAPSLARQAVHTALGPRLDEPETELIEVLVSELGKPRTEPGGYGLTMIDRGASRWGISSDEGSCVWFECAREPPAD